MDCESQGHPKSSSITHANKKQKSQVEVKWRHPAFDGSDKTVNFVFTVVQSFDRFWAAIHTRNDLIVQPLDSDSEDDVEGLQAPIGERKNSPTSIAGTPYGGCFESKGCSGMPAGCVEAGDCQLLFTYAPVQGEDSFDVTLRSSDSGDGKYFAIGISSDGFMGADLVFACVDAHDIVPKWNVDNRKLTHADDVNGIDIEDATVTDNDGKVTCGFRIKAQLVFTPPDDDRERKIDLAGQNYYLLLAKGPSLARVFQHHGSSKLQSSDAVDFTAFTPIESGGGSGWVRAHGIMMVLAWLAAATSGILFARHSRETWTGTMILGKDLWFRVHQLCMITTFLLTLMSFIVVIADRGFFGYDLKFITDNPHPVIGGITVMLCLIQPPLAVMRCHPDSLFRPVFNWVHWFVGVSAWTLAFVTIWLAGSLGAADFIPTNKYSAGLLAFAIVNVVAQLLLEVQRVYARNTTVSNTTTRVAEEIAISSLGETNMNLCIEDIIGERNCAEDKRGDLKGSSVRKIIMLLLVIFVWIFAITLSVLIGVAEPGQHFWLMEGYKEGAEGEPEGAS